VVNVTFYSVSFLVTLRLAEEAGHVAAAAAGLISLLAVILLGEVSPKGVAVGHPTRFARTVAPPLFLFYRIVRPVSSVLNRLAKAWIKFLSSRFPGLPYVTRDELKMLVEMGEHHGVLDREKRDMIQQVVELANIRVSGVMTPRVDVPMFNVTAGREALEQFVRQTHEEYLPVYEGSRDNVLGVVRSREVFLDPQAELRSLIRPVRFVPETQTIERLLQQFRDTGDRVAIAVDEFGGTAGLATQQDIMEEVVGDIRDEFEPRETPVRELDADTYLLDGNLNTHEWRQLLGVGFDPPGIETVAGFVISLLGRIPKEGDSIEWRGLRFVVEKMAGRRIVLVRVQIVNPLESSEN